MLLGIFRKMSRLQTIAVGFFVIIMIGTVLLMMPFSSRNSEVTSFLTCLFTSASATCVTGLSVVDTFSHWSFIGQLIMLILIQIGGLGFVTFGVGVSLILNKRIGLKQRGLIRESVNVIEIGGVVRLVKMILKGTFLIEGVGAVLLAIRFVPQMGWGKGIWYGIFHSISAFCNAGFDLMGCWQPSSSFTFYTEDAYVLTILMSLIIIGSIGFFVWADLKNSKWHWKRYTLHTKMVLSFTVVLILAGAILFFILERNGLYQGLSLQDQICNALFSAVTPRTAGFNAVSNSGLCDASKMLTTILMFIGGSPGSTAGGVKTTTVFVLLLHLRATYTRSGGCNIFGRRIENADIEKAAAVVVTNLTASLAISFVICALQNLDIGDLIFEVVSAISTVGMSAGLTGQLSAVSQILIIALMYIGRVGSMSFGLSFTDKKRFSHMKQPVEKITIG